MADEWIVRVEGEEYGPVDADTLREWRQEGRLIPANSVRPSEDPRWITAGEIPGIFPAAETRDERFRGRTLPQIIAESFRIYGRGFIQFFCLALFVAIPSFLLKLALAYIDVSGATGLSGRALIASVCAVVMVVCLFIAWPIFIAGMQFATADLAADREIQLRDVFRRAFSVWSRLARLCVAVYGAYMFWIVVPVLAIISLAGFASIGSVLIAVLVLALQVYMAGRLFVNFMFWQQTSVLDQLDGLDALHESKELARSRPEAPRLQRPLYRGAILASLWLVLLLALSSGAELPFVVLRLHGITDLETAQRAMQSLLNASAPDLMTIASYALSTIVHAVLRPLLGIAFVLLYFDAKSDFPAKRNEPR